MTIRDIAGNPLPFGQTGMALGFTEALAAEEVLPLKAYNFLIDPIRTADLNEGALFVKRFFDGIQTVWQEQQASIFAIKDLWSTTKIPDEFLVYLKNIVGWTPDLDYITKDLDDAALRRLIAASVPLWKTRGPEDATINILRLLTNARLRIWNWFDFRWVTDESETGEEHQGRDPWIIDFPLSPSAQEMWSNLRIADDGTLNRTLVEDIVKLMRASGERVEISYIDFLDLFTTDGDASQWKQNAGSTPMTVSDCRLNLVDDTDAQEAIVNRTTALDWANYVVYWRARDTLGGSIAFLEFYRMDDSNFYALVISIPSQRIELYNFIGGSSTLLATWYASSLPMTMYANTYYGIRVHIGPVGADTRIRVYIDNILIIDYIDVASPITKGSIGVAHYPGSTIQVDEVELFQLPLDETLIDVNP